MFVVLFVAGDTPPRARAHEARRGAAVGAEGAGSGRATRSSSIDGTPITKWDQVAGRRSRTHKAGDDVQHRRRSRRRARSPRTSTLHRASRRRAERAVLAGISRRRSSCRSPGFVGSLARRRAGGRRRRTTSIDALGHDLLAVGHLERTSTCSPAPTRARPTRPAALPVAGRLRAASRRTRSTRAGSRWSALLLVDQRVRRPLQPACRCCRSTAGTSRSRPTRRSRRRSGGARCRSTRPS